LAKQHANRLAILCDSSQLAPEAIGGRVKRNPVVRISTAKQTFFGTPHGSELRFEVRSKISEPEVQGRDPIIS
jgi:hypothetical protein